MMNSRAACRILACVSVVFLIVGLSCSDEDCVYSPGPGLPPRVPPFPAPRHEVGEMILIPAGFVRLGQEGVTDAPPHDVWVDAFSIGRYEVTNGEYQEFIDAGGYNNPEYWNPVGWDWRVENEITLPLWWEYAHVIPGSEHVPAYGISWWEADAYCRWAGGRLPTEAEWEKAAKGGCEKWGDPEACDPHDTPTFPWGEELSGHRASYRFGGNPYQQEGWLTPVGYFDGRNHDGFQTIDSPSPYGLYDVAGNVAEWTSTRYADYPYDPDDGREDPPETWDELPGRVARGGDRWGFSSAFLRCAHRSGAHYMPAGPHVWIAGLTGFRCACD